MAKSLKDKVYKFTGVPLITELNEKYFGQDITKYSSRILKKSVEQFSWFLA
jgi:hypothetical protein